jgi:uncharacterized cupredoxin-like copper-binding protein
MRESTDSQRIRIPCRPALAAVAIAALGGLGIAGCGGGDNDNETTAAQGPATTSPAGGGSTVKLSETEYKIEPSDPSVKTGAVTFEVTNDGEAPHNLEVEGPSGEAELPEDLQPGDSGSFSVDLGEPGKYRFYCPVGNHEQLGMVGEVTVQG